MIEESTAPEAGQEAPQTEEAPAPHVRNYEAEARDIGWVPETEFKGPADRWKPAQKFVEDGERILPIVRANERRLREELANERKDFAERLQRIEKVSRTTIEAETRRYEAEIKRLRGDQRQAAAEGDLERFDALEAYKATLRAPEPIDIPQPAAVDPGEVFKRDNKWYGEDEDLTAYADGISQAYLAKNPNASLAENLRHTQEKVRNAFPSKFRNAAAVNGHAAVDSGGDFPGGSGKSDPLMRLPNEARSQAAKDMKAYPKVYPTAEAWIKAYNS